jgi:hypothetical protein
MGEQTEELGENPERDPTRVHHFLIYVVISCVFIYILFSELHLYHTGADDGGGGANKKRREKMHTFTDTCNWETISNTIFRLSFQTYRVLVPQRPPPPPPHPTP